MKRDLILLLIVSVFCILMLLATGCRSAELDKDWVLASEPEPAQTWYQSLFLPSLPYDGIEYTLIGTLVASNVADAITTNNALDRGCEEANPFYGSDPSNGKVYAIKGVATLLEIWAANKIEDHFYRKGFLGFLSVFNTGIAIHNHNVD